VADQLASAAELVLGPFGRVPAAVVRGVALQRSDAGAQAGLMPRERDLFRDSESSG
jgi:F420-0:gamma-glutamyl ligase